MKIGILGGSYNPIHYGHLYIAETVREELELDKVIFIPTGTPPHKNVEVSADNRFDMTKLAISDNEFFDISDIEIKTKGIGYTKDIVKKLKEIYPDDKLYYIVGGDSLRDMKKWYKPEEFLKLVTVVGVSRNYENSVDMEKAKAELEEIYSADVILVKCNCYDISSTELRESIKNNKSLRYKTPKSVIEYIKNNKLYL